MKYTLIFTTYFSILMLGLLGARSVQADQIIFSQFDGDHTWTNMIINVNSAKTFIEPGVAYVSATNGYRNIESPGVFGVKGVKARAASEWSARKVSIVTGGYQFTDLGADGVVGGTGPDRDIITGGTTTYDFVQVESGSNDYHVTQTIQGEAPRSEPIQTWSDAELDNLANGQVAYTDIAEVLEADAVEGVEEVKAKKARIASREEPQVAKAVVVVPKDANMYFFVLYFFDQRITYLQLLDNYQQMHPLVPFTGNK